MKQRLTTELVQIPKLIRTLTTERIKRRELNKSTKLSQCQCLPYYMHVRSGPCWRDLMRCLRKVEGVI